MITSSSNPKIKWVRALLTKKKERAKSTSYVIEGVRLAEEALQCDFSPQLLLFSSVLSQRGKQLLDIAQEKHTIIEEVDDNLLQRISNTENSQGILIVCPFIELPLPDNLDFALLLDGISDPGNLGTILRTALAFNVQALLSMHSTTDFYSPKVVRSAMGAHFHLPYREIEKTELDLLRHKQPNLKIYVAGAENGMLCWQTDLTKPTLFVIGSEAHGTSQNLLDMVDGKIFIPMYGKTESLNAAVATSILCYETIRQRKQ